MSALPSQQAELIDDEAQWLDDREELQGWMLEASPREDASMYETLTLGESPQAVVALAWRVIKNVWSLDDILAWDQWCQ